MNTANNGSLKTGEVVAVIRRRKRLSQQVVADMAGVSRVTLARLEAGNDHIQLNTLARIAEALGLSLQIGFAPREDR